MDAAPEKKRPPLGWRCKGKPPPPPPAAEGKPPAEDASDDVGAAVVEPPPPPLMLLLLLLPGVRREGALANPAPLPAPAAAASPSPANETGAAATADAARLTSADESWWRGGGGFDPSSPGTPSLAAEAKRDLFNEFTAYAAQVKSAKYTDIRGALAQASFELKQRPESERFIILFSDMLADYGKACDTSKVKLDLSGIHVIAANVIKSDPADPQKYFDLLKDWEAQVVAAGGTWALVASPDQLPKLVSGL
jgi:hypothetical protein